MSLSFKKEYIIISLILFVASTLRIWNLEKVPPSPSMDEASISYNAYSILTTGDDEYGELPGLSHRSYDDWRRATYLYIVVPFVALFDLSVVSVRLPAVILSLFTVLAFFYISLELFPKRSPFSLGTASLSAFLLTISPWHIYISRLGHESNAYLSFAVFGVLCFLKGEKTKKPLLLFLSFFFFILSMISYYAGQVFIPLFVSGLLFIYRKNLISMIFSDKRLLIGIGGIVLILIPLVYQLFSPTALVRFQGTSTFKPESHLELFKKRVEFRNNAVENNDVIGRILYSTRLFPIHVFMNGYFDHFNPMWLFANSSAEPHKVPNMGILYLWQIPFIIIGVVFLSLTSFVDHRTKKLIFLWIFLGPFPAAIATQTPHAMRAYLFIISWQILTALGVMYVFFSFKKLRIISLSLFSILIMYSVLLFYKNYFEAFPKEQSKSFHYAFSKTVPYILSKEQEYKKIVFSNKDNLYQSYMVFLYHSQYSPWRYQQFGGTKSGGYAESHYFDKYEFRQIDFKKEQIQKGILYVVNVSEVSNWQSVLKTFQNLDGKDAIALVSQ